LLSKIIVKLGHVKLEQYYIIENLTLLLLCHLNYYLVQGIEDAYFSNTSFLGGSDNVNRPLSPEQAEKLRLDVRKLFAKHRLLAKLEGLPALTQPNLLPLLAKRLQNLLATN